MCPGHEPAGTQRACAGVRAALCALCGARHGEQSWPLLLRMLLCAPPADGCAVAGAELLHRNWLQKQNDALQRVLGANWLVQNAVRVLQA